MTLINTLYTPPTPGQLEEALKAGKKYVPKYNNGAINHWQLMVIKPDKPPCAGCRPRSNI